MGRIAALRQRLTTCLFLLFPCAFDPLVDGLASGEALFRGVPVGDLFFAQFPAEQHDLAVDAAGKVEQPDVDVLDLHPGSMDFGDRIFGTLHGALTFSTAAGDDDYV